MREISVIHRCGVRALGVSTVIVAMLQTGCFGFEDTSEDSDLGTGGTETGTGGESTATGGVDQAGGTGGVAASGTGGEGAGSEPSCDNVTPCGGEVAGTWAPSGSCLALGGELDLTGLGVGCRSAAVKSATLTVTGTWTADASGGYTDDLTWTGQQEFALTADCLEVSNTVTDCPHLEGSLYSLSSYEGLNYTEVHCEPDSATGGCSCTATIEQAQAGTTGTFTTEGNVVTTDAGAEYSYCVEGTTMSMTPQKWATDTSTTTTGTVVFQKQ